MLNKISVTKENSSYIFFAEFYTYIDIMGREARIATKTQVAKDNAVGILYDDQEELTVIGLCPPDLLAQYLNEVAQDYKDNDLDTGTIKSIVISDIAPKELMELVSEDVELAASALQKKLVKKI